jgi:putative PIN family toxin of toxin-antitoxin system
VIKVVIDTNLFISGVISSRGAPRKLQNLWIKGEIQLVTSKKIITEIFRVINLPKIKDKYKLTDEQIQRLIKLIFRKAIITEDLYKIDKVVDDISDNKFLECALEGKAEYIISGDPDLLNLKHYHHIEIINVVDFLNR